MGSPRRLFGRVAAFVVLAVLCVLVGVLIARRDESVRVAGKSDVAPKPAESLDPGRARPRPPRLAEAVVVPDAAPPAAAAGLVVRAVTVEGAAVPGVHVVAFRGDAEVAAADAVTGANGTVRLSVTPGDWCIDARDAKWGACIATGHAPSADAIDLVVAPGEPVLLHVTDDTGAPVARARVTEWGRAAVVAGDDGTADLGVAASAAALGVSAPGHVPWHGVVFPAIAPHEVVLTRGGALIVHVREADGRAVPKANVFVSRDGGREILTVEADENGDARIDGWAVSGSVDLRVTSLSGRRLEASTTIPPGVADHEVDVRLPPGRIVRGTVIRAGTGTLVEGARICSTVEVGALEYWAELARTGPDGRFEIEDAPGVAGEGIDYLADAPGLACSYGTIGKYAPVPDSNPEEITIEMEATSTVIGRIVDSDGKPVVGAHVVAMEQYLYPRRFEATTGTDGRFEIASVPAWEESLFVHHPGHAMVIAWYDKLAPGERRDLGDIGFDRTFEWRARIVDTDGHVVERGSVRVGGTLGLETFATRDFVHGKFAPARNVSDGATASVHAEGFLDACVKLSPEVREVVLRRPWHARGRVVLVATAAVPVGRLMWHPQDGQPWPVSTAIAPDGTFEVDRVAPGSYRVTLEKQAQPCCVVTIDRDGQDLGTLRLK